VKITFIAYDQCALSGILSLIDGFTIANLWHSKLINDSGKILPDPPEALLKSDTSLAQPDRGSASSCATISASVSPLSEALFETEIVSRDGRAVNANNGMTIQPHRAMEAVEQTDVVLIPAYILSDDIQPEPDILDWIVRRYKSGSSVGALCTGTFMLAMTGLLDGKQATTNWQLVRRFKRRFPDVNLRPDQILTVDDNLICSGAVTSIYHLGLYLIEKYGSSQLASICSKSFLIDPGRQSQLPYTTADFVKKHGDRDITRAQQLMEQKYAESISMDDVAWHVGLSPRHFKRRFKSATGETPLSYLQQIRIEAAKKRLETTNDNINEITWQIGYEDISTFRRLFKKHTALSPKEYRERFMSLRNLHMVRSRSGQVADSSNNSYGELPTSGIPMTSRSGQVVDSSNNRSSHENTLL